MRRAARNMAIALLYLTLFSLLLLMVYLHFFAPEDRDISGEWTAQIDMTGQAAVTAYIWLQDIEAVSVSLKDVESGMGELTVQVDMVLERTDRSTGTFRCNIAPESYENCEQAAYEAYAALFRELVAERLRMSGYAGDTGAEAVEALVSESFGMSTVDYLRSCTPALLPPLEELQARYDGSGTYETAEGVLIRQFEAGSSVQTKAERYIRDESELILTGEEGAEYSDGYPVIYILKDTE